MYQSIYYDYNEKQYYIRDDKKDWFQQKYQGKYYYLDEQGDIPTLDGNYCRKIDRINDWNDPNILEKDIDKLTRYLVDHYYKSDEPPSFQKIGYIDIETEIVGALTIETIKAAPMGVTSIALYDEFEKKKYCWVLDKTKQIQQINQKGVEVIPCFNEEDLLEKFLNQWEECDFTIITGWNSGFFDIPVLYYRISKVLGHSNALRLSPIRKIRISEYDEEQPVEIGGINHLDYMLLFKKYITKQEDSYKLHEIGIKYVKLGKISYEGNLNTLFNTNLEKFIEYNIRDIDIIIELEKKQKFIELTINICHLCHVPYEQIYLSTVLNDGAILTYLKRKGIVSPNKPTTINKKIKEINEGDEVKVHKSYGGVEGIVLRIYDDKVDIKFKSEIIKTYPLRAVRKKEDYAGGYLKEPIPGLYEWIIDLDFTSLYPKIIQSLNMGLETLIGKIVNKNKYDNNWTLKDLEQLDPNKEILIQKVTDSREVIESKTTVGKILKFIKENKVFTAANGSLFRSDVPSIVCEVLDDWFNKRSEYKDLMKKAYKVDNNPTLGEFYDKRQHAYKIKLNDVYGSYAINGWRYTDGHKFISAAITLTGQRLDQEAIKFANEWMNKKLGTNKDYVITADTDSLFIHVKDLLIELGIDLNNKEEAVKETLKIASELQKSANEYLNVLAKELFNIQGKHYFELKQEVVLERGYFAGKRRYAQYIINKEGVPKEELDIKGMDLMKSNMPITYRKFGEELLKDILFGKSKNEIDIKIINFKNSLKTRDWHEIAKPTGLKKLNEYIKRSPQSGNIFSELEKKCPINTRAAIYYNDLLRFKKQDKTYSCLVEGDKMKYVYLKNNPYNIDVIGFTGNDPEFISNLIEEYVDREEVFESVLKNKLENLYKDIGYDFPSLNPKVSKFFRFL